MTRRRLDIPCPIGHLVNLIGPSVLGGAENLAGDRVKEMNANAMVKEEYLTATLTRFKMDLDEAEEDGVLLRSRR